MWKPPCCPTSLNTAGDMDIAILLNHVLRLWLETSDRRVPFLNDHLTFAHVYLHYHSFSSTAVSPPSFPPHPHPPRLKPHLLNWSLTYRIVQDILNNSPQYHCHQTEVRFTDSSTHIGLFSQCFTASTWLNRRRQLKWTVNSLQMNSCQLFVQHRPP